MSDNANSNDTPPTRRRSLFDLLDQLLPTPRPSRRRSSKEVRFGHQAQPPASAADVAARERLRHR